MNNGQLEMSLETGRGCAGWTQRRRRHNRAQWWFARMRQVVERATDWQPLPVPRPEQIWFNGTYRQIAVGAQPRPGQPEPACEICE